MSLKERNLAFDIVKALMMLWVIWGHLGLYNVVEPAASVCMLNAKIGVNMPVFFVIGGYLAASTFANADWAKLLSRTIHFMWPQVAVAVLYAVLLVAVGGHCCGAFRWVMNAWFLHTYAIIYFVSALVFQMADSDRKRWGLFLCIVLGMLLCPSRFRISWCGQVIHMFPYFVFGLMCMRKVHCRDWRVGCACGALYLTVVFLQGDSNLNGMNFWRATAYIINWHDGTINWHEGLIFVARTVVGVCGSIFALFFVNVLIKVVPRITMLSSFGMTTLGVYVLHEYPLYLLGRHMPISPLPMCSRWLVAIVVFVCCHCLVVLLKRWTLTHVAFFGNEVMLAEGFRKINNFLRAR